MKIPKTIKNFFANTTNTNENKTKLIGLLTILIILWLILYFIPEIITSLFNTPLGNLILVLTAILISMYNVKYGIIAIVVIVIMYRFSHKNNTEGFRWTDKSTKDFLQIQHTINPQSIFDVDFIQENQASQEELDYFLKNGHWPWSQKVKDLYMESIKTNPYIRTLPESALKYTMTIYNQAAILRILSYQTKEGQFLLNGVLVQDPSGNKLEDLPSGFGNFPYKAGIIGNKSDDVIKCNTRKENGATLERITYTGKGGIYNEQTSKVTPVDYKNLENIIPGFKYLNGACNPCGAINAKADYSCPFQLRVKDKSPFISDVWQYLWNINDNPLQSVPSFLTEYINPTVFPLLSELQTELKKENSYHSNPTHK